MAAVQQVAVVQERRRRAGETIGESNLFPVEDPHEHVVDVADLRVGTPERIGVEWVGRGPAAPAGESAGRRFHRVTTPVRSLKSAISSSHASTRARNPVQNAGLLRARKSSTEMPRCSTQV